ncbi:MAG: fatty acid desaturase [Crocinitomicaceae bacterium]
MFLGVTYCLFVYLLAGIGTSMGYHRVLTHKSADLPKWFEYTVVIIGLPAGTPIQWVGNHRAHHGNTDVTGDPHSPVTCGFWYAHCGWYINSKNVILCFLYASAGPVRMIFDAFWRPRTNQQHNQFATEIEADPFYKAISKPIVYQFILLIYITLLSTVSILIFGSTGIVILWILLVIIYNLGDSVDSIGHLYGEKIGQSEARNNVILGWLSFGDGWHANHHINPTLANHGLKRRQFDLTFLILKGMKMVGLVKNIEQNESK